MGADTAMRRRTQIIVDRAFQLQYVLIWLWVAVVIVAMLAVYYLLLSPMEHTPAIRDSLVRQMFATGMFVVFVCAFMGVITTKMTHRVAGAAFNLQRSVERLRTGDLDTPIRLRPGDYLQILAGQLDGMRGLLRERREAVNALLQALEACSLPPEGREAVQAAIGRVKASVQSAPAAKPESPVA
jgi:hypothetical protein